MRRIYLSLLVLALFSVLGVSPSMAAFDEGEIRILILTDVDGPYADSAGQGILIGSEMAKEDFLAMNPSFSTPIKFYLRDHDINGTVAMKWATKMYEEEKIDAVTELSGSGTAIPVQLWARDKVTDNKPAVLIVGAGSSSLTSDNCSPVGIHWQFDTYALAKGMGKGIVEGGGDKWFFVTVDHGFGLAVQKDVGAIVEQSGGEIVGSYIHGVKETNFFPIIEEAMDSEANVIAIANAGTGAFMAVRQAHEMGAVEQGFQVVNIMTLMHDIRKLGLYTGKGLQFVHPFFWNFDEKTREFAKRFKRRHGVVPSSAQASIYSVTLHYLRAAASANSDNAETVIQEMKNLPVLETDPMARNAYVRADGRMIHDMYLLEVKKPSESKEPMDYFRLIRVIPGDEAYRPMEEGNCKFAMTAKK